MGRNRLSNAIRAEIHHRIAARENPDAMIGQAIYEMKCQLAIAQRQVAVAIADERNLRKRCEHHASEAAGWEQRAMLAVRAGDDNLARAALQRKHEIDEIAAQLTAQWHEQHASVQALHNALRGLANRIADAERQRRVLAARASRAQAQMMIAQTLSAIDAVSPWSTLERMEDRVIQMEAQAEALADLHLPATSLEAQFHALEASVTADDELRALKARMGVPLQLPAKSGYAY